MAVRTSTLAFVMLLALVSGTLMWALRRPARSADEVAADGLARTLRTLATQTGDDATDVYLTTEQAGLLKSLCTILESEAPASAAAACPPCASTADDADNGEADASLDPNLVEECPACARCPPPVLPVRDRTARRHTLRTRLTGLSAFTRAPSLPPLFDLPSLPCLTSPPSLV